MSSASKRCRRCGEQETGVAGTEEVTASEWAARKISRTAATSVGSQNKLAADDVCSASHRRRRLHRLHHRLPRSHLRKCAIEPPTPK